MRQLLKVDPDEWTRNCSNYIISPIRTELINFPIPPSPCPLKRDSAPLSTAARRFRDTFGKCLGLIHNITIIIILEKQIDYFKVQKFCCLRAETMLVLQAEGNALLCALGSCPAALWAMETARSLLWQGLSSRPGWFEDTATVICESIHIVSLKFFKL